MISIIVPEYGKNGPVTGGTNRNTIAPIQEMATTKKKPLAMVDMFCSWKYGEKMDNCTLLAPYTICVVVYCGLIRNNGRHDIDVFTV